MRYGSISCNNLPFCIFVDYVCIARHVSRREEVKMCTVGSKLACDTCMVYMSRDDW